MVMLKKIHPEFDGIGISAMDNESGILSGRPYGGIGVMWKKSISTACIVKQYDDSRLLGITVDTNKGKVLLLNAYLPYQCPDHYEEYCNYLGKISAIVDECDTANVVIAGDFNAAVNTPFEHELMQMCNNAHLIISDHEWFGRHSDTSTYMSAAHNTTSWLDHVICSHSFKALLINVHIHELPPSSDHHPLGVTFAVSVSADRASDKSNNWADNKQPVLNWSKAQDRDIHKYRSRTKLKLANVLIPDPCACTDISCSLDSHVHAIDELYSNISLALGSSSDGSIPKCHSNTSRDYVVPGWNDYVQGAHQEARNYYLLWRNMGKPRQGPVCELMRRSRLNFKYSLRQCQNMEETARADAMAKTLESKDVRSFWKTVSKTYSKAIPLATTVNGAVDPKSITNMWKNHFSNLLNSVKSESNKTYVNTQLSNKDSIGTIVIHPHMVGNAIEKLKSGKSCGNDGLAAEHFKYADKRINVLLSLFYTFALNHGYLPPDFMKTIIVPLVKNKTGDTTSVDNYRPIALVTVASKIFEIILLSLLEPFLSTCDNQFGFKKGHSTDHCIFVLKNAINYYRSYNSPVYACFLDASKCFDKINHWTLFKKLISRGIPMLLVRILIYWYSKQTFCVKWGSISSDFFTVSNGVRQGGILSPYLFSVYVNDLSMKLNGSPVGLTMCNMKVNHLFYADDLCVMSSSPGGLQYLLNTIASYAKDNDIVFNKNKSVCMVFKPVRYRLFCPIIYLDDNELEYSATVKYLGVILNHKCSDDDDMLRHLRGLYARSNTLLRKFHHCTIDIKLALFRAYCLPTYCTHLWVQYNKCTYSKLRVAFNNVYRRILGFNRSDSASHMYVSNRIDNFDMVLRKNVYGFMHRVCTISNEIVQNVTKCAMYLCNGMWSKWMQLLYTHT